MTSSIAQGAAGWSNAAEDRITLADPDAGWGKQFEAEAAALLIALRQLQGLRLEHFGSTAVPGLRAKPVIDMMLIHPRTTEWPALVEPLSNLGYVHWAENPRKDRMFFVKGMPPFGAGRTHHFHVRLPGDFEAELRFRDLLRADTALAREYEQLKEKLAEQYPADRDAYTEGKSGFVSRVLEIRKS